MSNEPVGVLIIGAGASGAAFAWRIAGTGMKVLCLEQGPWVRQQDFPTNGLDWEKRSMGEYSPDPNVRGLPADYPVNSQDSPITPVLYNAVGGSTILWSAHFPRLRPGDFTVGSDDGVADDWPVRYQDLETHFATNDRMMGVSGMAGDPAYPYHQPPLPALPLGRGGNRIARGFEELGWHWWPSDSAITSREYEGRDACINLGACNSGCTQGAKASTDITYWPIAQRNGVEVRTGCRVQQITLDDEGLADGVLYFNEDGVLHEQKAEIVVVACNGIGTPRLLLNSKSDRFPDGLANSSGLVGKNLMFHPITRVSGIFEEPVFGRSGPPASILWSHEFNNTDPSRGVRAGLHVPSHPWHGAGANGALRRSAGPYPLGRRAP